MADGVDHLKALVAEAQKEAKALIPKPCMVHFFFWSWPAPHRFGQWVRIGEEFSPRRGTERIIMGRLCLRCGHPETMFHNIRRD